MTVEDPIRVYTEAGYDEHPDGFYVATNDDDGVMEVFDIDMHVIARYEAGTWLGAGPRSTVHDPRVEIPTLHPDGTVTYEPVDPS